MVAQISWQIGIRKQLKFTVCSRTNFGIFYKSVRRCYYLCKQMPDGDRITYYAHIHPSGMNWATLVFYFLGGGAELHG